MILSAASGGGSDDRTQALITVDLAATLLRHVISAICATPSYDVSRASRWIRCIVQLVIDGHATSKKHKAGSTEKADNQESTLKLVEEVVDQAVILTSDARRLLKQHQKPQSSAVEQSNNVQMQDTEVETGPEASYPAEELEWLSTTLFNLAVDFFVAENEEEAKRWSSKAVELADVLAANTDGDGGMLAKVLRGKVEELGLGS